MKKRERLEFLRNLLLVVAGTVILALGSALFLIPFDLVAGGVSGVAIILNKVFAAPWLTVDLAVTVLTWGLFLVGLLVLGRDFALKTLVSALIYPPALFLCLRLVSPDVLDGFFDLRLSDYSDIAILLAALFGGVLVGAGCAITFLGGGSTGGMDILAFVICKVFPRAKSSVVIFLLDAATVLLGVVAIQNLAVSLLGVLSAFVCAFVVDRLFLGSSAAYVANIITDYPEAIHQGVMEHLDRTTTLLEVVGGYSGKKKSMVMVTFTVRQYAELLALTNRADKNAFITIHRAHEIGGEGWTR